MDQGRALALPPHPRLFVRSLEGLQAAYAHPPAQDELRLKLTQGLVALADLDLRAPPIERDQNKVHADGKRVQFHHESRKAVSMILDCSAAFFITNETRYLDCCVRVMRHVVSFEDWNGHEKFLDTAEMSLAVSVGYDWLYPFMTTSDRAVIQDGILRHALSFAPSIYGTSSSSSAGQEWARKDNNGNMVNNCGMLAAALAIGDLHPDLFQTVVSGLVPSLSYPMGAYNPDGCWHEGPQYWSYGTQFAVLLISMLESALNTDLGLLERFPGFGKTALYRFHIVSPAGLSFNYGDNNQDYMSAEPHLTWLAQRFGLESVEEHSRALLANRIEELLAKGPAKVKKHNKFDRTLALHALWFPSSSRSGPADKNKQLDRHFRGHSHIVTLCSSWATSRALYVGLKGGSNGGSHGHLDLGTFVLDAGGERWALDLGGDDYALPEYASKKEATSRRWSYLRTSNRGHNTVTVGSFSGGGVHVSRVRQSLGATAPLTHFLSTPDEALAALDLGPAYPLSAVSIARGVRLFNARSQVLLQDDFSSSSAAAATAANAASSGQPSGIIWRLFTRASIALNPDGLSAVLSSSTSDKQMLVQLLLRDDGASKARFSVASAHPDAPSPIPADDEDEEGEEEEEEEEEGEDEEDVEVGAGGGVFGSLPLTEKERKKAEQKAAKREARHQLRAQERAQRRALKGKDPQGSGGSKKKQKDEHPEAHFRRGVDRSKVKEDANEGVSLLVITALLLPGETLSLPVLFTPLFDIGASVGVVEPSILTPVSSWPGAL